MKSAYMIVEGPTDAEILRAVIDPRLLVGVGIVEAGGLANMASLARSLLVRRSVPVAILADAYSLEKEVVDERRDQFRDLVHSVAGRTSSAVVMAVPEVEAVFFSAPDLIQRLYGHVPPELIALGRRDPKGVLAQLNAINQIPWDLGKALESMTDQDREQLRETQPMKEVAAFLEHVQSRLAVA